MIVKFSEVGVNERFAFATKYPEYGIKISAKRCIVDGETRIRHIRYTTLPCEVDNTCTCTEPRQLTFNDLSIGSIFQFGSTFKTYKEKGRLFVKLDNMHYRQYANRHDKIELQITGGSIVVCTHHYAQ